MIYKVYFKNYLHGSVSLIGVLPEKRETLRGLTLIASGLKWAKSMFGGLVKDAYALFIIPSDENKGGHHG